MVTTAGERVRNAVVTDAAGIAIDTLVKGGLLQGDPERAFRVVTLTFLANAGSGTPGLGGDRYPFPAYAENRFDTGIGEQKALADFLSKTHPVRGTPYAALDTPPSGDLRIQNLAARVDTVRIGLDADGDVDRDDVNSVLAARNTPASGPGIDPRDLNADGVINVLDARLMVLQCTRPRCATK